MTCYVPDTNGGGYGGVIPIEIPDLQVIKVENGRALVSVPSRSRLGYGYKVYVDLATGNARHSTPNACTGFSFKGTCSHCRKAVEECKASGVMSAIRVYPDYEDVRGNPMDRSHDAAWGAMVDEEADRVQAWAPRSGSAFDRPFRTDREEEL